MARPILARLAVRRVGQWEHGVAVALRIESLIETRIVAGLRRLITLLRMEAGFLAARH